MKKNAKIVCINPPTTHFTKGKVYTSLSDSGGSYFFVQNDKLENVWTPYYDIDFWEGEQILYFKPLSELRDEKLKKILDTFIP